MTQVFAEMERYPLMVFQLCRNRSLSDALANGQQHSQGEAVIIGYITFALVGALASSALMWPHGVLEAALAAPIGGSLSVLLVAVWALSFSSARIPSCKENQKVAAHFTSTWTTAAQN